MQTESTKSTLTEGQKRIRINFNASQDPEVAEIKQKAADLWDQMEQYKNRELSRSDKDTAWKNRTAREFTVAQAHIEDFSGYAVKGLTAKFQD